MRLRPYRKHEDDTRLIELVRESTNTYDTALKPDDYRLLSTNLFAQQLEDETPDVNSAIIVAIADTQEEIALLKEDKNSDQKTSNIIGFIRLNIRANDVSTRPEGYISNLCVTNAFHDKNIASMLIEEARRWAQNNGLYRLTLQLLASDDSAMSFYEKHGFQVSSVSMELSCAQPE
jgi:ribosomal protein S18 acetylase RimI-like enzyme